MVMWPMEMEVLLLGMDFQCMVVLIWLKSVLVVVYGDHILSF